MQLTTLLPKGSSVLDIGAGYGNNAKYLLQKGYSVTAIETNPAAIASLRQLSKDYPDRLRVVGRSVDIFNPTQKFDAVICYMVLHFLENEQTAIKVIDNIKSWTKPAD